MTKAPLFPEPETGPRKCLNCLAVATHDYCPKCGQATRGLRASFRDLIGDFFTVWFGAEAKSWHSLWLLFRKPGALCLEYQQGRRARYVPPLRLYLFMSLVMILAAKCRSSLHDDPIFLVNTSTSQTVPVLADKELGPMEQGIEDSFLRENSWWQNPIRELFIERTHHMDRMSDAEKSAVLSREMMAHFPIALLFILPFFALYLRILWFRQGSIYFDHFIFALQFQSFLFALLTCVILIPAPTKLFAIVFMLYPPIYLTLAQRRVTQRSFKRCIWNTIALGPLLLLTSVGVMLGLALVSFLTL